MKKFKAGDRVRLLNRNSHEPEGFGPEPGSVGVLIDDTPYGSQPGHALVEFTNFTSGHDGHCNFRMGTNNRWFVEVECLELIEPERLPSVPANPTTKLDKIKAHLLSGRSLTQLEALALYGAFRLAARVHELKAQGWKIVTVMKEDPNGCPYAEYRLRTGSAR